MLPAGLIRLGDARNAGKVKVASARESHEMEETGKVREIKALPRAKRLAKRAYFFFVLQPTTYLSSGTGCKESCLFS